MTKTYREVIEAQDRRALAWNVFRVVLISLMLIAAGLTWEASH